MLAAATYQPFTLLARTASEDSADLDNTAGNKYAHISIYVSAVTSTPSVVFTIQGKDAAGHYYSLLVSPAITATGVTILKIGPGMSSSANAVANDFLPRVFRVSAVAGDADSMTYAVSVYTAP